MSRTSALARPVLRLGALRLRVGRLSVVMVAVLLMGMLPMAGLLWMVAREGRDDETAEAAFRLMQSAQFAAGVQADALATVEFSLTQLAQQDASWTIDPEGCSARAAAVAEAHPYIAGLAILRGDGTVHCTPTATARGISLGDRPYVQKAFERPGMTVGEPLVARISGRLVLPVAMRLEKPPLGADGPSLFAATLDLARVAGSVTRVLTQDDRAADGRVKLFDLTGRPLITYPDRAVPQPDVALPTWALDRAAGIFDFVAADGRHRILGFAKAADGGLIYGVSLVTDIMLVEALQRFQTVVAMAIAAGLFGLGVALLMAHARILRPLAMLTDAAKSGGASRLPTEALPGEFEVLRRTMSRMLVDVAQREAKLRQANQELARLAERDALTGIPNRRCFENDLAEAWSRGLSEGEPVALVLLDVDFFKKYNDRYGHMPGDVCLRKVAQAIDGVRLRERDTAARLGGEEFVLLLPRTDTAGALVVAERALAAIRARHMLHEDGIEGSVTASAGVAASIPMRGIDPLALLTAADVALYAAKAAGRNRAMSASCVATLAAEQPS
jgi:diguanylate cyclase (GGDEF)-like protein